MGCGSSTQPSRHSSAQARFTSHCAGLGCEGKGVSWYPVIATRKFSGSWALYVYSKITLLTFPAGPSCPPPPSPSLLGPIAQHNATTCHGHHIPVDSDMARPGVAGSCGIDSACTVSLRACVCVCVCVCEKCGPFSPREHTAPPGLQSPVLWSRRRSHKPTRSCRCCNLAAVVTATSIPA